MKNQLIEFPQEILKQIKCLRKINPTDKFPCFNCFDDKYQKINCKACQSNGFVYGSHPMVQFSEDFIEKKINYLKNQQQNLSSKQLFQNSNQKHTGKNERDKVKNSSINIEQENKSAQNYSNNCSITKSKILNEVSSEQENHLVIHNGYHCDQCQQNPIEGHRYHCNTCQDYDLCSKCYRKELHNHQFTAFKLVEGSKKSFDQSKYDLTQSKSDLLYKNLRKSINITRK